MSHAIKFVRRLLSRDRAGRHSRRTYLRIEPLDPRIAPANVFNVNSAADILNPLAGTVTLRSAIEAANTALGPSTINLTVTGTYKITIAGALEDNNAPAISTSFRTRAVAA